MNSPKTNKAIFIELNFFILQICPLRKGKYKEKSTEIRQAALQQSNLWILKKNHQSKKHKKHTLPSNNWPAHTLFCVW